MKWDKFIKENITDFIRKSAAFKPFNIMNNDLKTDINTKTSKELIQFVNTIIIKYCRQYTRSFKEFDTIDTFKLKNIHDNKEVFTLLDIREDIEVQQYSINSIPYIHIPMNEIPKQLHQLNIKVPIVVMCNSGVRSEYMCNYLRKLGFNAINYKGGIKDWINYHES